MRPTIPSTIANAVTRAERAAGTRRLQICIAARFAGSLPTGDEVLIEIGAAQLSAQIDRRRDSGSVILSDRPQGGPATPCLFSALTGLGLGVGDHPEFELVDGGKLRLLRAEGQETLS